MESGNESSVSGIGDRRLSACSMKIGIALENKCGKSQ